MFGNGLVLSVVVLLLGRWFPVFGEHGVGNNNNNTKGRKKKAQQQQQQAEKHKKASASASKTKKKGQPTRKQANVGS